MKTKNNTHSNTRLVTKQNKKSAIYIALTLWCGSALVGCAHTIEHDPHQKAVLESKISEESAVLDYSELRTEAENAVSESYALNSEQKAKLIELKVETTKKLDSIQKEILKLKSALIKNIVDEKYQPKEVIAIEKRIEKLSKQKLTIFFQALESGNKILGKASAKEKILQELKLERESRGLRESRWDRT